MPEITITKADADIIKKNIEKLESKKEFKSLSDWIRNIEGYGDFVYTDKIKEFIKRRRDDLHACFRGEMELPEALGRLKKEAGPKLITK